MRLFPQIDYYVGQMTELLKRRNLYDNTMIIYTSDHGIMSVSTISFWKGTDFTIPWQEYRWLLNIPEKETPEQ